MDFGNVLTMVPMWVLVHPKHSITRWWCFKLEYTIHHTLCVLVCTSVASAVGSSVNRVWAQLIFPSKPNFGILSEFSATKFTQKSISFTHLSCENYEINSIESDPLRAFLQQLQECFHIPMQFSVSILFYFLWENGSIINSFYTITPNSLKPSQCTPTHQELYKDIKSLTWSTLVWAISAWQNKTKPGVCHTVA